MGDFRRAAGRRPKPTNQVHVQLGGPGARLLGNRGGLPPADDDTYDCLYLWAIQITLGEGERFVNSTMMAKSPPGRTAWKTCCPSR